MNAKTLAWAVFIALGYVCWPIVGKRVGAPGVWMGTIINFCGLVCMLALSSRQLLNGPMVTTKAILALVAVGIFNGAAVYVYSLKTTDPQINTGVFIVLISILLTTLAPLVDGLLNATMPSAKQFAGIALGPIAIYLINSK